LRGTVFEAIVGQPQALIFKFEIRVYSSGGQFLMRRIFATIALLLIGWTTVEPASLASLVSSSVPLCCRKGGKHHCTGSADEDATDGTAHLHAVAPVCPHRAPALAASTHSQLEALSELAQPLPQVYASVYVADSSASHLFVARGVFDRGPPQSGLFVFIAS